APGRDGPSPAMLDHLTELVEASRGGALCLFSSRRGAELAAEHVRARLDLTIAVQGEDSMANLVRTFREDEDASLFGTLTLWQGVDVSGRSLRLVTIDRIPFPRPDDPLTAARQERIGQRGGNGFMSISAQHAAMLLAQGAGRLIRSDRDRGMVAVLDPRLATARYGGLLREPMPPLWPTADPEVALAAPRRLADGPANGAQERRTDGPEGRSAEGRRGSDRPQHRHDLAEDLGVIAEDRGEGRVVGHEPDVVVALDEGLHRRLAVDHRRDDLALLRRALGAHHHPVAVADGGVDHRVADHLQEEELAVAHEPLGEGEDVLDLLLGGDRHAGGDPPHQGDAHRVR